MSRGSRYFKISQSFFSRGGTICLSDYCCWTASTRAGEPEKPILCRGRGLFDKIAWNSMKSSCSNWETEKSVVLHLIHFGSTSYQVQQLKDKVAEIQANSGAFWRFLCFEIGFLLSSLSQLSLRLHLTWVAWMFFLWIGTEFFIRCGSRTATARTQCLESRSSTGKLWPVALDFSESRLHATEKTLRRVTIWNGLLEMYARIVQRDVFLVRCSCSKTSLLKLRWATALLFEAIPYCRTVRKFKYL